MDLKVDLNSIETLIQLCMELRIRLNNNNLSPSEKQNLRLILKNNKERLRYSVKKALDLITSPNIYIVTYRYPQEKVATRLTLTHINRQDIPKIVHYTTKGKGIIIDIQEVPSIEKVPLL